MEKHRKAKHEIDYGQKEEKAKRVIFSLKMESFLYQVGIKKGYTKFFPLKEGFFMERFFFSLMRVF